MILVDEYFRHYPAQRKVAEFLLRNGICVRNGRMMVAGVSVSATGVAKATGVTRKVVQQTVERITGTNALRLLFERLALEMKPESIAPVMNWEVIEVELNDASAVGSVLGVLPKEDNPPVAITFRNLPGESSQVVVVFDRPVDGDTVARLEALGGVSRVVIKPPERDRTRLVCTFCDVIYCSRKKFEGDGGDD